MSPGKLPEGLFSTLRWRMLGGKSGRSLKASLGTNVDTAAGLGPRTTPKRFRQELNQN